MIPREVKAFLRKKQQIWKTILYTTFFWLLVKVVIWQIDIKRPGDDIFREMIEEELASHRRIQAEHSKQREIERREAGWRPRTVNHGNGAIVHEAFPPKRKPRRVEDAKDDVKVPGEIDGNVASHVGSCRDSLRRDNGIHSFFHSGFDEDDNAKDDEPSLLDPVREKREKIEHISGEIDPRWTYRAYNLTYFQVKTYSAERREGPGENGSPVHLEGKEKELGKETYHENEFNVVISDKIAMDRSIPDNRVEE